MTGSTTMKPTLVLLCAALGLAACGGSSSGGSGGQSAGSDTGVFTRANQRNAGYDAIKQSFDQFFARCGGSLVTKRTHIETWNGGRITETRTHYWQVDDLEFAVIAAEVSPVDQKNGIEFAGRVVFSDASLYRVHTHEHERRGDNDRYQDGGWSDWKTLGPVTASNLEERIADAEAWGGPSGEIQRQNGTWDRRDMSQAMRVPFIEAGEVTKGNEVTTFEKPDCAEVPKE